MNWIHMSFTHLDRKQRGFTLVELIVGIAIVGILAALSLPSLGRFTTGSRVEGEILELHRLLLITRNSAVTSGNRTTICPLVSNVCTNQWDQEISVFEDINGDGTFQASAVAGTPGDVIIRVKAAINSSDNLQFSNGTSLTYSPSGSLVGGAANNTFSYCPAGYSDESKGVVVSALGRPYITIDEDNDGLDEDREGTDITCS
jgi:prepilin-type N-terminal cleavage/methylation domain-containing protein